MNLVRKIGLFSLLLLLLACSTRGKVDALQHTAHLHSERLLRDSIFVHDSIFIERRADTVVRERMRTLFRERVRVDTFLLRDTLYKERVVSVKGVEKGFPSALQLFMCALLLCVVWCLLRFFSLRN